MRVWDRLTKLVLEQALTGVSNRRFVRTREPVGEAGADAECSTTESAVSREFVGRTGEHLRALMARSLADVRLAALMLDGLELKGRCASSRSGSQPTASRSRWGSGTAQRRTSASALELLADLVDRGLDCDQGVLDHLPERDRPAVKRRLRSAWKRTYEGEAPNVAVLPALDVAAGRAADADHRLSAEPTILRPAVADPRSGPARRARYTTSTALT